MKTSHLRNSLLLLLAAAIWGFAFVAQSVGMDYVGPFTFNMTRNIIGGLVLIPCMFLIKKLNGAATAQPQKSTGNPEQFTTEKNPEKLVWIGGICCGLCLASAIRYPIHYCWTRRFYYCLLYYTCSNHQSHFLQKEM